MESNAAHKPLGFSGCSQLLKASTQTGHTFSCQSMLNKDVLPLQINSIKELHHPLDDDGLAPHHRDNEMAASKEQLASPTNKDHTLPENNLQVG